MRDKKKSTARLSFLAVCILTVIFSFAGADRAKAAFSERKISSSPVNTPSGNAERKISGKKTDGTFSEAMAQAAVNLFREAAGRGSGDNILISPDSVFSALSMMGLGAKGQTASELKSAMGGLSPKTFCRYLYALHRKLGGSSSITYRPANSVWYRKSRIRVKRAFLAKAAAYCGADIYAAPFNRRTVKDINNWVYNKTKGKIASILNRLDPSAALVLVNAVYFKGKWAEPYRKTVQHDFTREDGSTKSVRMLVSDEKEYVTINGARGFVKKYAGGRAAFVALLPPEGMSVSAYIGTLSGTEFISGYKNRVKSGMVVHTRMPKFSYDYQAALSNPLAAMGIRTAFTGRADFSGIAKERVRIDQVYHKTHISVDRNGTEASAATAIVMKATAVFDPDRTETEVFLDRPFVYAIVEAGSGIPLFIGAFYG